MSTKKKVSKTKKNNHNIFSFVRPKEKLPESFDIGKFDHVRLNAGSIKFKSLYGRHSL
jgi:hypothetical protein